MLSRASAWRLLTGRLGWSLQRTERRAVEGDESEIVRWIAGGDDPVSAGGGQIVDTARQTG
ncbi:winged helix-turn-helix domain-containing protein [Streptomyces sp. NPDC059985]|uniref:winged helix-turn-helix domain-containing protein n=1 Tax=Streptomyces sp. NPDC059985 TaxID=3347025 RepID=UPI0036CD7D08